MTTARVAITGANGLIGRALIARLGDRPVRALVRSEQAATTIRESLPEGVADLDIAIVNPSDPESLAPHLGDCGYAVHLAGGIRGASAADFETVNLTPTVALMDAVADSPVQRVCYLGIAGTSANAPGACFASRWKAEEYVRAANTSSLILRVPMVLGRGDYATRALAARSGKLAFNFRTTSLEQPIACRDVVEAIAVDVERASRGDGRPTETIELAGPESLTRAALQSRADALMGQRTTFVSLPIALGMGIARVLEAVSANPPVSRAMLHVLDHDDAVDAQVAARELGIELTSLNDALRDSLADVLPAERDP